MAGRYRPGPPAEKPKCPPETRPALERVQAAMEGVQAGTEGIRRRQASTETVLVRCDLERLHDRIAGRRLLSDVQERQLEVGQLGSPAGILRSAGYSRA